MEKFVYTLCKGPCGLPSEEGRGKRTGLVTSVQGDLPYDHEKKQVDLLPEYRNIKRETNLPRYGEIKGFF